MPRATLSFVPGNRFQMSAAYGRYSQAAEDDYIVRSQKKIGQNVADHAILSLQYNTPKTILRIEPYYKKYLSLPLLSEGIYTGDGHGVSKGVDFFIQDASLLENLTVTASYSFNDSERLWLDYAEARTPDFASRHNLRLSAKYPYGKLIFGITESYARGYLYMVRIVQDPATNGQRYYLNVIENYEKALKLKPDNSLTKFLYEKFQEGMKKAY